jgi:hypothetical protein
MCGELDDDGPGALSDLCVDAFLANGRKLAAREATSSDPVIGAVDKLAFARLAGLLAAHLPPGDDPLRKVIEALMHGYAEADRLAADTGHDHGDGWHEH